MLFHKPPHFPLAAFLGSTPLNKRECRRRAVGEAARAIHREPRKICGVPRKSSTGFILILAPPYLRAYNIRHFCGSAFVKPREIRSQLHRPFFQPCYQPCRGFCASRFFSSSAAFTAALYKKPPFFSPSTITSLSSSSVPPLSMYWSYIS